MTSPGPLWIEALERAQLCPRCHWQGPLFEGLRTHGLGLVCPACFHPFGLAAGEGAAREVDRPMLLERRRRAADGVSRGDVAPM
jgi:hypothetical protein